MLHLYDLFFFLQFYHFSQSSVSKMTPVYPELETTAPATVHPIVLNLEVQPQDRVHQDSAFVVFVST